MRKLGPIILVLLAFGCKQSTAPEIQLPIAPSGAFHVVVNGQPVESENSIYSGVGGGLIQAIGAPRSTSKALRFILRTHADGDLIQISFYVPSVVYAPHTYSIDTSNGQSGFTADQSFMGTYNAGSGNLSITKFDTLNNLISGTFALDAVNTKPSPDRPSQYLFRSGSFTDLPLTSGGFGEGVISANISGVDSVSVAAIHSNTSVLHHKVEGAYTTEASGISTTTLTQLTFDLKEFSTAHPIALGGSNVAALISTRLSDLQATFMNTQQGSGQLTITSFDSMRHRFSGVFNFSGTDSNGKTINVTDGKIDNVEWFEQ